MCTLKSCWTSHNSRTVQGFPLGTQQKKMPKSYVRALLTVREIFEASGFSAMHKPALEDYESMYTN